MSIEKATWERAIAEIRAMQQDDFRNKYVTVDDSGVYKCVGQNFYMRMVTLETPFGNIEVAVERVGAAKFNDEWRR